MNSIMHTNMTNFKLPEEVQNILTTLSKEGFEAYLVGGSVRNLLMQRQTNNWDFTTNATPQKLLKVFPKGFYDNKFGTVGIAQGNGEIFEITTFRSEGGYSDKRHPDKVTWGKKLEDDLSRRDFTINAIALRFVNGEPIIIDPFDGRSDIEKKIIRTVGDADIRFSEDALRLIRAIRISSELGFTIEEKTLSAISKNASLINSVSKERVRDELLRIMSSNYPQ